jgi:hypothetical protein
MRTIPLILALGALAACAPADDASDDTDETDAADTDGDAGDSNEALIGCLPVSTEPVTDLDAALDGFESTAAELIAATTGMFGGDLALEAGGTVGASMTVTRVGDVVVERRDWVDDGGQDVGTGPEPAPAEGDAESGVEPGTGDTADTGVGTPTGDGCPDVIRFSATVAVAGGTALDESLTVDVHVATTGVGELAAEVAFDDLVGDATPAGFDPAEMAEVRLVVAATLDAPNTWTLDVGFFGVSPPSGTGDDSVVVATSEGFAWGQLSRLVR